MYTGRRDPEIRIAVPHNQCSRYNSRTSGQWIEIFVPPENITEYAAKWGSIMVKPEQVCNIGGGLNIIRINDGAQINNSVKDDNHAVISTEVITPDIITGRWLKYYRYCRFVNAGLAEDQLNIPSSTLYQDMTLRGMAMPFYMNRLPFVLE